MKLAKEFSKILKGWLTKEELNEINYKNENNPEYQDGVCATHDYCDPNEAMLQAFKKVNRREFDFSSDKDSAEINIAWNKAKQKKFYI